MNCPYCERQVEKDSDQCRGCGLLTGLMPHYENDGIERSQPFWYNGYIVWEMGALWHWTWQFWLGDKLLESITLSREVYEELVEPGQDCMPMIWDLFKLTQGETEVLRIAKQNWRGGRPADFEIRRVPTDREAYASSLSEAAMKYAIENGQRVF